MRSSKSRSRSKSNRSNNNNRPSGNITNRVFDSSGPEGKVRGTPQQIIEKYNQLARDAHLSGDRVAVENFQQHAEHYQRLLGEAQREMDAKREEQERQNRERQEEQERHNRERQAERDRERAERIERQESEQGSAEPSGTPSAPPMATTEDPANAPQPDVLDVGAGRADAGNDAGLVETPESAPRKPRRPRTRKPAAKPTTSADAKPDAKPKKPAASEGNAPEAAE